MDLMLRHVNINLHPEDQRGHTPLLLALIAREESFACSLLFLSKGPIKINGFDNFFSVTHVAARCGLNVALSKLLDLGADPNGVKVRRCLSPLHWAAEYGYIETCRLLLEHGADPNADDDIGYMLTPLYAAIWAANREVCELLIKRGAKVLPVLSAMINSLRLASDKRTLWNPPPASRVLPMVQEVLNMSSIRLHEFIAQGFPRLFVRLIEHLGLDINLEHEFGDSALFVAMQKKDRHTSLEIFLKYHKPEFLTRSMWMQLRGDWEGRAVYKRVVQKYWSGTEGLDINQPVESRDEAYRNEYERRREEALQSIAYSEGIGMARDETMERELPTSSPEQTVDGVGNRKRRWTDD